MNDFSVIRLDTILRQPRRSAYFLFILSSFKGSPSLSPHLLYLNLSKVWIQVYFFPDCLFVWQERARWQETAQSWQKNTRRLFLITRKRDVLLFKDCSKNREKRGKMTSALYVLRISVPEFSCFKFLQFISGHFSEETLLKLRRLCAFLSR